MWKGKEGGNPLPHVSTMSAKSLTALRFLTDRLLFLLDLANSLWFLCSRQSVVCGESRRQTRAFVKAER